DAAGSECSAIVDLPGTALRRVSGALELTSFGTGFGGLPNLVPSSDGTFWFVTFGMGMGPLDRLERITTAGDVTEVRVAGSMPGDSTVFIGWTFRALAPGADGDVWAHEVDVDND